MVPVKEKDWITPVAVVGGAGLLAAGIWMFTKKPPGTPGGTSFTAHFTFDYNGDGGSYIIQVSLGSVIVASPWFDHVEGLTWQQQINLPSPGPYEFDLECDLPLAATPGVYDTESGIREAGSNWLDFEIVVRQKGAVRITE